MLKKIEIGEAGEKQGLEAKIVLKTAEINLLQAQNDFNQQKKKLVSRFKSFRRSGSDLKRRGALFRRE